MKKNILLIVILLIIPLLTGCFEVELGMDIKKDKSVTIKNETYVDEDIFYNNVDVKDEKDVIEGFQSSYEDFGYNLKEKHKDNYKGYIITKEFNNLEELVKSDLEFKPFETILKKKKEKFFTTYEVKIKVSGDEIGGSFSHQADFDSNNSVSNFVVKLPYKPTYHNADEVIDGKILKWSNLSQSVEYNELEFTYNHYHNWILWVIISVLVAIITIITLIFLRKRRKSF